MQNMQNIAEHLLHPQSVEDTGFAEHSEHADDVSIEDFKTKDSILRDYLNGLAIGRDPRDASARRECIARGFLTEDGRLTQGGDSFLWRKSPGTEP